MFLARLEMAADFFAYIAGKNYERFHTGPYPMGTVPETYTINPLARLTDGSVVVQCLEALADDDVRWPAAGSIRVSDWGW